MARYYTRQLQDRQLLSSTCAAAREWCQWSSIAYLLHYMVVGLLIGSQITVINIMMEESEY